MTLMRRRHRILSAAGSFSSLRRSFLVRPLGLSDPNRAFVVFLPGGLFIARLTIRSLLLLTRRDEGLSYHRLLGPDLTASIVRSHQSDAPLFFVSSTLDTAAFAVPVVVLPPVSITALVPISRGVIVAASSRLVVLLLAISRAPTVSGRSGLWLAIRVVLFRADDCPASQGSLGLFLFLFLGLALRLAPLSVLMRHCSQFGTIVVFLAVVGLHGLQFFIQTVLDCQG
jgi:hypothetical protein